MDDRDYEDIHEEQLAPCRKEGTVTKKIGDIFETQHLRAAARIVLDDLRNYPRLELAVLKLCNGTITHLREIVDGLEDMRECIAAAEHPNAWQYIVAHNLLVTLDEIPADGYEQDITEYKAWIMTRPK